MQKIAETGADQCHLAHLRMYPIMLLARAASPRPGKVLLTPSLSELSALEDREPLSAMCDDLIGLQSA